jgi:NaMN:DMB phosphoribosyltransferase
LLSALQDPTGVLIYVGPAALAVLAGIVAEIARRRRRKP